jgi:acetyl esterase/lipase
MQKIKSIAIALVFLTSTSCTRFKLGIANTSARFSSHYSVQKDLSYGSEKRHKLNVFTLKEASSPAPVVIFFYGGSWRSGDKDQYRFMGEALSSKGMVVVIPDYGLYPSVKFPEFVHDAAKAFAWVKANIAQYGGDPNQIYIMGHSAGAHVGAMLAFDKSYLQAVGLKQDSIKGFIGLAGPYDFLPFTEAVNEKIFAPKEKFSLSQPINFIDRLAPPALLIHGLHDKTVGIHNSRNLSQKISKHGGSVQTKFSEELSHTSIIARFSKPLRGSGELLELIADFIAK